MYLIFITAQHGVLFNKCMINILTYINSQPPVSGWTAAKKQSMLDRFCKSRGYEETIEGQPNPVTKAEFFNNDILNYVKSMVDSNAKSEAINALTYEQINFN